MGAKIVAVPLPPPPKAPERLKVFRRTLALGTPAGAAVLRKDVRLARRFAERLKRFHEKSGLSRASIARCIDLALHLKEIIANRFKWSTRIIECDSGIRCERRSACSRPLRIAKRRVGRVSQRSS